MCTLNILLLKKHALMTFAEIRDAQRSKLLVKCAIVVSQNQNIFEIALYSVGIYSIYTLRYCIRYLYKCNTKDSEWHIIRIYRYSRVYVYKLVMINNNVIYRAFINITLYIIEFHKKFS